MLHVLPPGTGISRGGGGGQGGEGVAPHLPPRGGESVFLHLRGAVPRASAWKTQERGMIYERQNGRSRSSLDLPLTCDF